MRTQKEIEKDLTNVAGGAAFLTMPQLEKYTGYSRQKIMRVFNLYGVTYIGKTSDKRYEVASVAKSIHQMQRQLSGILPG